MRWILPWSAVSILLTLLVSPWGGGCSAPKACQGTYGSTLFNTDKSVCTKHCECNNQRYEGYCIGGRCVSVSREKCNSPNRIESCVLQPALKPAFDNPCDKGRRACRDEGLTDDYWGNCTCAPAAEPSTSEPTTSPDATQEPTTSPDGTNSDAGTPEISTQENTQSCSPPAANNCDANTKNCCNDLGCIQNTKVLSEYRCACKADSDCPKGLKCCKHPDYGGDSVCIGSDQSCPSSTRTCPPRQLDCSTNNKADNLKCCGGQRCVGGQNRPYRCSCNTASECPAGARCCPVGNGINLCIGGACPTPPREATPDAGPPRETASSEPRPTDSAGQCSTNIQGARCVDNGSCCTGQTCMSGPPQNPTRRRCTCQDDASCPTGLKCCKIVAVAPLLCHPPADCP